MTEDREALRLDAIAIVTVRAKAKLGAEHYERLDKAQSLVIEGAVNVLDDGSATVTSPTKADPTVTAAYIVTPKTCTCPDHTVGKAPDGLCKHILALMIYRRAVAKWQELLDREARPAPAATLPEAPISICLKGTLAGVAGTLVTLRGNSMAEIAARADEVKAGSWCVAGIFDADAEPAPQGLPPAPVCPEHGTAMRASKFGGWFCAQATGDVFCTHKIKARA